MLPDGREQGVLRGWIRSLACHYGSRALPLANPICYRLIGQITYYYRRFISHISPRLRPLVTSPLITGRVSLPRVLNRVLRRSCALYCRKNMYIYRECLKKFLVLLNFFSLFIFIFPDNNYRYDRYTIDTKCEIYLGSLLREIRLFNYISRKRKARVLLRPRRRSGR